MRHLFAGRDEAFTHRRDCSQARRLWSFAAAREHPLHTHTNSQKGLARGDALLDGSTKSAAAQFGCCREVPHAWAYVGDTPGRVLIAFTPANKMEAYFRDNEKRRKGNEYMNDAEVYRAYGMELMGPPLSVR